MRDGDGRRSATSSPRAGRRSQLAMKVAVAVGQRPALRRRRPGDPADRRARRRADRRAGRCRAPGRDGRGRARPVGARIARRPGAGRRPARSDAGVGPCVRRRDRPRRRGAADRGRRADRASTRARPSLDPARGLRAVARRTRRVPRRAAPRLSAVPALRRDRLRSTTATPIEELDEFVRSRAADHVAATAATCCS